MDSFLPDGSPDTSYLAMLPQSNPSHVSARHGGWLVENGGSSSSSLRATLPSSRSGYGGTEMGLGNLAGKIPQYREGMGEGFRASAGGQREVGLPQDNGIDRDIQRSQQQTEEYQHVAQQEGQQYEQQREQQQYMLHADNRNAQSSGLQHYNREEQQQLQEGGSVNLQALGLQQYNLLQQQHEQQQLHEQQHVQQQQLVQHQLHNKRHREEEEEEEEEDEDQQGEHGEEAEANMPGREETAATPREIQRRRSSLWTHQEILLLIQEKRKNVEYHKTDIITGRVTGAELRWAEISKALEQYNINKSLRMCKKKWEANVQSYRQIKTYHQKGGVPFYWDMDSTARKASDLPARFELELYEAMDEALKAIPAPSVPVQIVDTSAPVREDQMEEVAEQAFKEKTLRESQRKKYRQEQQDSMIAAFREMATTLCNTYAVYESQMSARQIQHWQAIHEASEARAKEMNSTIMRAAEIYADGLKELAEAFRESGV